MREIHHFRFTVHPGETKMYHDLKHQYWWHGMKRDIAQFISKCLTCQQVKEEHCNTSNYTLIVLLHVSGIIEGKISFSGI